MRCITCDLEENTSQANVESFTHQFGVLGTSFLNLGTDVSYTPKEITPTFIQEWGIVDMSVCDMQNIRTNISS